MRLLVTGGAGFIGSNFISYVLEHTSHSVINLDALTYAGNLENLAEVEKDPRYRFVHGDVADVEILESVFSMKPEAVIHLAAETHVDRSILESGAFVRANVNGTHRLLEIGRRHGVWKFIHVSTDEVYGSLGSTGRFTESSPLQPNSPYSASKAASDLLVRSYFQTYSFPAVITRCSNNYGPCQFPEKMIPLMICNAMDGVPLPVYGDGGNIRDWIHVSDHCAALVRMLEVGEPGEVYNIGSDNQRDNLSLVREILCILGKPESLIQFVADRPGHDRRYAIDSSKIRHALGWSPKIQLPEGLARTVQWYRDHPTWVERVRTGAYRTYYRKMYHQRDRTLSSL
ncbi:MAG: dTDP-glucose 4,6-dehydratase [Acidobacteria bacterium]|nr:dTDP-glucose 4,6-dehydratase [Acidobacteriota bacterium]